MSGVLEPWLVWTTEHLVSEVKCSPYIEENRFCFPFSNTVFGNSRYSINVEAMLNE